MSQDDQQRHGEGLNRASVAAILFVILIVIGCIWLIGKLNRANDELNCVASGRRNCQQIDE